MSSDEPDEVDWVASSFCDYGGCVEICRVPDGHVMVRDGKDRSIPHLTFTVAEWVAFVAGVRAGEFD